ncbi:MAG: recombination mediator RecR [Planctomycetota bacterium]
MDRKDPTPPRPSPRRRAEPDAPDSSRRRVYPVVVERLIDEFTKLPGIGRRSAERMAFHILKSDGPSALALARAIEQVKASIRHCRACSNLSDSEYCGVCSDPSRDRRTILIVEQPRDLIALEQTAMYRGLYHVLLGRLSPLEGIGPSHLTIDDLLQRVDHPDSNPGGVAVEEVIMGLNPTLEGDGTALYLAELLKAHGVKISRLARGLPSGSQLEYANKAVLADAIVGRQRVE